MVSIRSYPELDQYARFFLEGRVPLMILSGAPGIGKTEQVKRTIAAEKKEVFYLSGYMTKTQFVKALYEHRDELMVIDDTDNLFADRSIFGVLRAAFDTGEERWVDYASPSPFVQDIPAHFSISAPLLIITNGLKESIVMNAFKSRAICIDFRPSAAELSGKLHAIAKVAGSIPNDAEVLSFFDRLAPVSREPNFRAYILSAQLKERGIDWRKHLREAMKVQPLVGAMIEATETGGKTFAQRSAKFTELTGKSARTYSRLKKEYGECL